MKTGKLKKFETVKTSLIVADTDEERQCLIAELLLIAERMPGTITLKPTDIKSGTITSESTLHNSGDTEKMIPENPTLYNSGDAEKKIPGESTKHNSGDAEKKIPENLTVFNSEELEILEKLKNENS